MARATELARTDALTMPGLQAPVQVSYDRRGVPHVFAANELDVYRALGYVVARDRLFQLYVQTMASSGRLTEMAGARALPLDREIRSLGLPRAVDREMVTASDTAIMVRLAVAYADGVNAYIDRMPASELPLEFRLLGIRPPRWSPADSYRLLLRMGWLLARGSLERERSSAAALVGDSAAAQLFPDDSPIQEPIQPNGARTWRLDSTPLPPPGTPDARAVLVASALPDGAVSGNRTLDEGDADRAMASNNWAVSPSRSASRHALLAGDPHLDLSLPSIWYEAHVVVRDTLDAYGVTVPGAPNIIIGFNRDVAWTFTNTEADVMDFYAERVDDDRHPARYMLDGAWRPLERRVERYAGKRGETIAVDTLLFTHRGPMRRVKGRWLSTRWTVLEAGTEMSGFRDAARARSAAEFQNAMSASYKAAAQNMLAADRAGHIAIRSTGRFPIRPGDGRGSVVRDGTTSASDWRGDLSPSRYPQANDPAQGFVVSANQQPADPRTFGAWLGGRYEPWRAMRINTLLRADSSLTPDAMRRYQTDVTGARAQFFLPYLLRAAAHMSARDSADATMRRAAEAARLLAGWSGAYDRADRHAVLFEQAMRELTERTWDELAPADSGRRSLTPYSAVLARLMTDSASAWWDDRRTPRRETEGTIVLRSLSAALDSVVAAHGAVMSDGWRWDRVQRANVKHLLGLPALSALDLPPQGGPNTVSPTWLNGVHGASWRMVVELDDSVRAWVIYPGGQSGNPLSARYRDHLPRWVAGELERAIVPHAPSDLPDSLRFATLLITPSSR